MKPGEFLQAARVPLTLTPQSFGQWTIDRTWNIPPEHRATVGPWDHLTLLKTYTASTRSIGGEVVMEDSKQELSRHLPIWLHAKGRVLVTGLGLGCVVRGLLYSPHVTHIDVVEIDGDILDVVGPEFEHERVTLHHADALTWDFGDRSWDCAWHDIWSDTDSGGEHLSVLHAHLMVRFMKRVTRQGAWNFPRFAKRRIENIIG